MFVFFVLVSTIWSKRGCSSTIRRYQRKGNPQQTMDEGANIDIHAFGHTGMHERQIASQSPPNRQLTGRNNPLPLLCCIGKPKKWLGSHKNPERTWWCRWGGQGSKDRISRRKLHPSHVRLTMYVWKQKVKPFVRNRRLCFGKKRRQQSFGFLLPPFPTRRKPSKQKHGQSYIVRVRKELTVILGMSRASKRPAKWSDWAFNPYFSNSMGASWW